MRQSNANSVPKTQAGRPRLEPATRARILELHLSGISMRSIEARLWAEGRPAAYNTIRNVLEREAPPDPVAPWQLSPYEGMGNAHPELVLPVLTGVATATGGRVTEITNRCADWVAALRLSVPLLSPWACYVLATRYRAFELQHRDTGELDRLLIHSQQRSVDVTQPPTEDADLAALFRTVVMADFASRTGGEVLVVAADKEPAATVQLEPEQPREPRRRTINLGKGQENE
jgi:hypothetical protein